MGGASFHLYTEFEGYRSTIPASSFFSVHIRSVEGSLCSPQKTASLYESLPLSVGVLLPCIEGLGSLSLPFPPPPLPACDPTLRPHPSSLCQSGAAQPCRGAELPATRHRLQAAKRGRSTVPHKCIRNFNCNTALLAAPHLMPCCSSWPLIAQ